MEMAAMAAAGVIFVGSVAQRKRKERSMWMRPMFERRRFTFRNPGHRLGYPLLSSLRGVSARIQWIA